MAMSTTVPSTPGSSTPFSALSQSSSSSSLSSQGHRTSTLSNDVLLVFLPTAAHTTWISHIKSRFPGLQVRWVSAVTANATAERKQNTFEELKLKYGNEIWEGVTLLASFKPLPEDLLGKVRFVQLATAGADHWLKESVYSRKEVAFCNASGCHPPQIAEWVIGSYLAHQHHFYRYKENMNNGYWEPSHHTTVQDSTRARMGILGYGAIGRQCARIGAAMGMEIYAYTRSPRLTPESRSDDSYCVPGTGDPSGLLPSKWFSGGSRSSINEFLAQDLDLLVICLPLTESTKNLLSKEQFQILSAKKTFVANVARGGHLDQYALVEALEEGLIRGAALDVAEPEPLPKDHKLWKAKNLLVTPHVSWQTEAYWDRLLAILEVNLERLETGKSLINEMNRELHY